VMLNCCVERMANLAAAIGWNPTPTECLAGCRPQA
jgi:hypothetical protein